MANYGNLLIFGAGGYGQVVKELAVETGKFNKIEFIDDNNPLAISKVSKRVFLCYYSYRQSRGQAKDL